jgi:hypothetical protein
MMTYSSDPTVHDANSTDSAALPAHGSGQHFIPAEDQMTQEFAG